MSLCNVMHGVRPHALRLVVHGVPGVGLSTFAAGAPSPIFIAPDDGASQLDVARLPRPERFGDVLEAVRILCSEVHSFKTLVIDPVTALEPLCVDHVRRLTSRRLDDASPGGPLAPLVDAQLRLLLGALSRLTTEPGVAVVLLSPSRLERVLDPLTFDHDRHVLGVDEPFASLLTDWADLVLFAAPRPAQVDRARAPVPVRLLDAGPSPAFVSKAPRWLPARLPLDWASLEASLDRSA